MVDIKWKEERLGDSYQKTIREKSLKQKNNPQKQTKGAWIQELYELLSTDL